MVCAKGPGSHGCGSVAMLVEPLEQFISEAVLRTLDFPLLNAAIREADAEARQREGGRAKLVRVGANSEVRRRWPTLPLGRRRAIIELLVATVTVGPAVRGRDSFDFDRISIEWRA